MGGIKNYSLMEKGYQGVSMGGLKISIINNSTIFMLSTNTFILQANTVSVLIPHPYSIINNRISESRGPASSRKGGS
jgi:hypothetical protein